MCNNNWKHLVVLVLRIFFLPFSGLSTWGRKVGRKFDQIKINDPNEKLHYVVTPPSPASSSIHARPASSICSNSHEDHNCTLLVISIFRSSSIVVCKLNLLLFYEKCHFWRKLLSFLSLSSPRNDRGFKKAEMHAKFQFEGLCAVIQPDLNKVEKCEKQDFFCRLLKFFNVVQISLLLRLILPSLGLDE